MEQNLNVTEEIKTFYLIRHGELKGNSNSRIPSQDDEGLNPDGVLEAELISSYFQDIKVDSVFSSPCMSSVQTTDIIAKNIGLPTFFKHSGLVDKKEGDWSGKTYWQLHEEAPKAWEKWSKDPINFCPPNGESVKDFVARVGRAFKDIIKNYEIGQKIILSTHTGVIRALIILSLNIPVENFFRIEVPSGSISRIDWTESYSILKFCSLSLSSKA
ncbi:MAG: histidine phosphatase family protein [Candidatus Caenarcaniphilales bacterium]|nr:histidine phosphatase family protein [Candidatus Caenarcaniphilales bacterium]